MLRPGNRTGFRPAHTHTYPYDTLAKVHLDCFIIPQGAPRNSSPEDYPATLEEIQEATRLEFFPSWGRELALGSRAEDDSRPASRLRQILRQRSLESGVPGFDVGRAQREARTIDELIDALKGEASAIQVQGRALTNEELDHLQCIQHTISWLLLARSLPSPSPEPARPTNLITYKIVSDMGDKLKLGARTACNFWNRFLEPGYSIVIRLGVFTQGGSTIARAYKPYDKNGVRYGRVEFNTKYLSQFTTDEIAGTIAHEIGHTLGIGWEEWSGLFDPGTGAFGPEAVARLSALGQMEVELDGGPGTALSHWDEERFDRELMTGYQDRGEHVLPVTIDLMGILGHSVTERLEARTDLGELLREAASVVFSRQDEARSLDLDHFEETELLETIPHTR